MTVTDYNGETEDNFAETKSMIYDALEKLWSSTASLPRASRLLDSSFDIYIVRDPTATEHVDRMAIDSLRNSEHSRSKSTSQKMDHGKKSSVTITDSTNLCL